MLGLAAPLWAGALAAATLLLVILCDVYPRLGRLRGLIYAACRAYIAFIAYTGLVMGSHFFIDVLVGSALVAVLFFHLRRQLWYKQQLAELTGGT